MYAELAIAALSLLRQCRSESRPPTAEEVADLDARNAALEAKVLEKLDKLSDGQPSEN